MKFSYLFCTAAALAYGHPAFAASADGAQTGAAEEVASADESVKPARRPAFNTGVARARDALDTAVSTSTVVETEINKVAPRSLAELFRLIPGIRSEAYAGDGNNAYTVRGLPLVSDGAKYIQLQENGLPVLEFGDVQSFGPDNLMRVDLNLAGVQAIRGGSASTFASNAPGGIINLIEKTGEVEGGSVQLSSGLDYEMYRLDVDYGARISDTLRFHVGGYFRSGEGPRSTGYNSYRGGQVKFNMTKEFAAGGHLRIYAKMLNDRFPQYYPSPLVVNGTNENPSFKSVANMNVKNDSSYSQYLSSFVSFDSNNNLKRFNIHDGNRVKSNSLGFETKFGVDGWTFTDKFRYSDTAGDINGASQILYLPASALAATFGGPGATVSYAQGENAGEVIANPSALNGNGLLALTVPSDLVLNDFSNAINDFRGSKVWEIGGGRLTLTGGWYHSWQALKYDWLLTSVVQDVVGGGDSRLVDITAANGFPVTQGGILAYGSLTPGYQRSYDVEYSVNAPYGSFNFHKGRLAVGGSIRYDMGKVRGTTSADGSSDAYFVDINGDGVPSSYAETVVRHFPTSSGDPVDYKYDYLSYSLSANFRVAETFSLFARYSRGARASAERILFSPAINAADGSLAEKSAAYNPVRQLEGGFKYRTGSVSLNLTGFLANVDETNTQLVNDASGTYFELVSRSYRAYGAELEGSWRRGGFSVNAGATLTHAEITADKNHPDFVGNTPRHQAKFIYQLVPQYDSGKFVVGASVVGTTGSYAQDVNKLRLPAYTTVGAFVQYRLAENIVWSMNASNLFDVLAITDVLEGSIPATGVVSARTLYGRTISSSLRFNF
ncbi:TonB-dependent receptor domain-containing protein [Novosphingobium malaysiense]|uniref:TonB-dependent receptor n=1 Tax=Novosphingobium malaysiense TaxID=1348853 RepID=A0A0B1ZDP9_9SPHN|nr:TonB-dependent receptor [Novosphingobium malaysiense]KHK89159.1 TonB-dependent receptor [Novosphingobium malaysiense]